MAQLILLEGKKISFDNEEVCSQLSISAVLKSKRMAQLILLEGKKLVLIMRKSFRSAVFKIEEWLN